MELHTLTTAKLAPRQVLDLLRDQHRLQCEYDPEADRDVDLSFETSVADWRRACDLIGWRGLAMALNEYWNTDISLRHWKDALTPPSERTLRDVCELLAAHATTENVVVPTFLGRPCRPAGVFFAVRELLERDGANVSQLSPSTPLADFALRHASVFAGPISQLAPGRLPAIKIDHPRYEQSLRMFFVCWLTLMGSLAIAPWQPFLWISRLILTILAWAWSWYAARVLRPESITFGELRTFRELCVELAPGIRTT